MASRRPTGYVDVDSDDSYLDLPEPRYKDRSPEESSAAVDRLLDPTQRRQHNLGRIPKLPPPVEH